MSVTSSVDGKTAQVVIKVTGDFVFNLYREFRDAYKPYAPTSDFVVDLSETRYLDSAALGMLLLLKEYAGGDDANVSVINARPRVEKVLKVANFDKQFQFI